jgi:predicted secreted hydrolase
MNPLTLQGIAQALWMKDYDPARIPPEILKRIESAPNSERSYAERFLARLDQLEANSISFVPSFKERYALLRSYLKAGMAQSPRQFYASCLFLGSESNTGYEPIPLDPNFAFPSTDLPQLHKQLGWHFFVGNFTDADKNHYSVLLMFWQYALLPPPLAKKLGLSDVENQSLEMHLAICDPQASVQYRANTVLVAGTTGLIDIAEKPFAYRLGKNAIEGLSANGDLFPARLRGRGWDMGKSPDVEFEIDFSVDDAKGYFMQGDGGCSPSVDGLGTLYYSAALLKLRDGAESAITIDGRRIVLSGGRMWYDHQWTTGFWPSGAAQHGVMRAVNNLTTPAPGGWDWFEIQFHANAAIGLPDEVQLTFAVLHSRANESFYGQTGAAPPGRMTATFKGKFIDAQNVTSDITGTMIVTDWVKIESTPNPAVYPVTNTWYPAGYWFSVDQAVPGPLKEFAPSPLIASGQTGFFAPGLEYTEGGAVARDMRGLEIGRGFAEGTGWAKQADTVVSMAGLPVNDQTRALLTPAPVSWLLRLASTAYASLAQAELKKIMAAAKGL